MRGPNVFAGYWRNPEATAAAFADGWLLTGDVAARDDEGYYRIVGRMKDMVISGGENVYPAEIENVLHEHPAVAEAAVVGVPDERWGEACARLRRRSRGEATEEELLEHLPRAARALQGAEERPLRRRAAAERADKVAKAELAGASCMTMKTLTRARRSARGGRLLEAAEQVFAELGYHDASIVKITEAAGVGQGTFYLYFASKKADLRRARARPQRARPARDDGGRRAGARRARSASCSASAAFFRFTARASGALPDHPAGRVRLARDAAASTTSG